jgi:hypothetical protein
VQVRAMITSPSAGLRSPPAPLAHPADRDEYPVVPSSARRLCRWGGVPRSGAHDSPGVGAFAAFAGSRKAVGDADHGGLLREQDEPGVLHQVVGPGTSGRRKQTPQPPGGWWSRSPADRERLTGRHAQPVDSPSPPAGLGAYWRGVGEVACGWAGLPWAASGRCGQPVGVFRFPRIDRHALLVEGGTACSSDSSSERGSHGQAARHSHNRCSRANPRRCPHVDSRTCLFSRLGWASPLRVAGSWGLLRPLHDAT